ncbi:hypothetical protein A1O3_04888 [Capronia epimyces CBS 606.96]|uniref:Ig-like domain-containing protein n=1 Tax=Capronia epimyces CBS 606.96 TaxID=1182542 RepID=W9Y4S1_9EURO|nr:uncharacterized protein A1O3_04888 [Capronia epimyces CBS 606.96]EXJ84221.1 hypothetical protein A1O3_04888 [Capronia epimyces CBS 606.96]
MVAIKNSVLLLGSLATLTTALPGFGQWQKPGGPPAGDVQGSHDGPGRGAGGPPSGTGDGGAVAGAAHPFSGKYPGAGAGTVYAHAYTSGDDDDDDDDDHDNDNNGAAHSATHRRRENAMYKTGTYAQGKYESSDGKPQTQHKNHGGLSDGQDGNAASTHGHSAEQKWDGGSKQSHARDVEGPGSDMGADIRFPHLKGTQAGDGARERVGERDGDGELHAHQARTASRGVYECMNKNFVLPCIWTPVNNGQCYNVNYGSQGSMGPDKGLTCTLYEVGNCNDNGWNTASPFVWPGIPDYQTSYLLTRHGFPDQGPRSYKCTYTSEAKGN